MIQESKYNEINSQSLVSVLITAYNCEDTLESCIQHLIDQTYNNLEIIVVEDGSSDQTPTILKTLAQQYQLVKAFFPGRIGRAKALNEGLRHCSGSYIAVNDADDYSFPERITKQVAYLNANPSVGLLGSWKEVHRGDDVFVDHPPTEDSAIRAFFAEGQPIQHSTVMMRTELVHQIGGYNERIPFLLDRDIFLRLARITKMHQLDEPLIILNQNENQYFRNKYVGFNRRWLSARYQWKAIYWFRLSPHLYLNVLIKLLYGTFVVPIIRLLK